MVHVAMHAVLGQSWVISEERAVGIPCEDQGGSQELFLW